MRASWLVSLLLWFQAQGQLTAGDLAEELDVSERTIYRDLFDLGAAGVPGAAAELGLGSLLAATRLKLLAAVPPAFREVATRAEGRFYFDPGG